MLKWLDRLNPTIAELYQALEQQVEKCPEAQRLTTHPGMGPLTALALVLIMGTTDRFHCGKLIASFVGLVPLERSSGIGDGWARSPKRAEFDVAFLAGGSGSAASGKRRWFAQEHRELDWALRSSSQRSLK
jgi:transposase